MAVTEFLKDKEIYERVILEAIPNAKRFIWIATADIKDLYVNKGKKMVPFLELLSDMVKKGILIRLVHAKEPGPAFRKDFDKYKNLVNGVERILCPRVHFKSIIIDGTFAYTGSANLTGAGIGAKSPKRRNFEAGIITTDPKLIDPIMEQFDSLWMGANCDECQRKNYCLDYNALLANENK